MAGGPVEMRVIEVARAPGAPVRCATISEFTASDQATALSETRRLQQSLDVDHFTAANNNKTSPLTAFNTLYSRLSLTPPLKAPADVRHLQTRVAPVPSKSDMTTSDNDNNDDDRRRRSKHKHRHHRHKMPTIHNHIKLYNTAPQILRACGEPELSTTTTTSTVTTAQNPLFNYHSNSGPASPRLQPPQTTPVSPLTFPPAARPSYSKVYNLPPLAHQLTAAPTSSSAAAPPPPERFISQEPANDPATTHCPAVLRAPPPPPPRTHAVYTLPNTYASAYQQQPSVAVNPFRSQMSSNSSDGPQHPPRIATSMPVSQVSYSRPPTSVGTYVGTVPTRQPRVFNNLTSNFAPTAPATQPIRVWQNADSYATPLVRMTSGGGDSRQKVVQFMRTDSTPSTVASPNPMTRSFPTPQQMTHLRSTSSPTMFDEVTNSWRWPPPSVAMVSPANSMSGQPEIGRSIHNSDLSTVANPVFGEQGVCEYGRASDGAPIRLKQPTIISLAGVDKALERRRREGGGEHYGEYAALNPYQTTTTVVHKHCFERRGQHHDC